MLYFGELGTAYKTQHEGIGQLKIGANSLPPLLELWHSVLFLTFYSLVEFPTL